MPPFDAGRQMVPPWLRADALHHNGERLPPFRDPQRAFHEVGADLLQEFVSSREDTVPSVVAKRGSGSASGHPRA